MGQTEKTAEIGDWKTSMTFPREDQADLYIRILKGLGLESADPASGKDGWTVQWRPPEVK